jgi:hypothetical protein
MVKLGIRHGRITEFDPAPLEVVVCLCGWARDKVERIRTSTVGQYMIFHEVDVTLWMYSILLVIDADHSVAELRFQYSNANITIENFRLAEKRRVRLP